MHKDVVEVRVLKESCPRSTVEVHGVHLDAHALVVADQELPSHRVFGHVEAVVHGLHIWAAHLELFPDLLDDVLVAAVDADGVRNGAA